MSKILQSDLEELYQYFEDEGVYYELEDLQDHNPDFAETLIRLREAAKETLVPLVSADTPNQNLQTFPSGELRTLSNADRCVRRYEDMSPDGYLELLQCPDGDIHVTVRESEHEYGFGAAVEFCLSGTDSPRTRAALLNLLKAMEADDEERPQRR